MPRRQGWSHKTKRQGIGTGTPAQQARIALGLAPDATREELDAAKAAQQRDLLRQQRERVLSRDRTRWLKHDEERTAVQVGKHHQAAIPRPPSDAPRVQPPPANPPLCDCGRPSIWHRARWWCEQSGASGCGFVCAPVPLEVPPPPLCDCEQPAAFHRERWWCARSRPDAWCSFNAACPPPAAPTLLDQEAVAMESARLTSREHTRARSPHGSDGSDGGAGPLAVLAESDDESGDESDAAAEAAEEGVAAAAAAASASDSQMYIVEALVAERLARRGTKMQREFKVRWKGYAASEDTWEPEAHLPVVLVSEFLGAPGTTGGGGPSNRSAARRVATVSGAGRGAGRKRSNDGGLEPLPDGTKQPRG